VGQIKNRRKQMLEIIAEKLRALKQDIELYEKDFIQGDDLDICERLVIKSRIEQTVSELSLFFRNINDIKDSFEFIRSYYIENILQKEKK
jgi:hypothetical protein